MRSPSRTALDRRRTLTPRSYADDPWRFGIDHALGFAVPPGGDATSRDLAEVQHRLICAWRHAGCRPSGAEIGRRWQFSKQTWSRTTLGQRWAGETVLAALITELGLAHSSEPGVE